MICRTCHIDFNDCCMMPNGQCTECFKLPDPELAALRQQLATVTAERDKWKSDCEHNFNCGNAAIKALEHVNKLAEGLIRERDTAVADADAMRGVCEAALCKEYYVSGSDSHRKARTDLREALKKLYPNFRAAIDAIDARHGQKGAVQK